MAAPDADDAAATGVHLSQVTSSAPDTAVVGGGGLAQTEIVPVPPMVPGHARDGSGAERALDSPAACRQESPQASTQRQSATDPGEPPSPLMAAAAPSNACAQLTPTQLPDGLLGNGTGSGRLKRARDHCGGEARRTGSPGPRSPSRASTRAADAGGDDDGAELPQSKRAAPNVSSVRVSPTDREHVAPAPDCGAGVLSDAQVGDKAAEERSSERGSGLGADSGRNQTQGQPTQTEAAADQGGDLLPPVSPAAAASELCRELCRDSSGPSTGLVSGEGQDRATPVHAEPQQKLADRLLKIQNKAQLSS